VQLYHYFVSLSNEFCHHNPLCCSSTSVCCCYLIIDSFQKLLDTPSSCYTTKILPIQETIPSPSHLRRHTNWKQTSQLWFKYFHSKSSSKSLSKCHLSHTLSSCSRGSWWIEPTHLVLFPSSHWQTGIYIHNLKEHWSMGTYIHNRTLVNVFIYSFSHNKLNIS
jgi:hypothetical protein